MIRRTILAAAAFVVIFTSVSFEPKSRHGAEPMRNCDKAGIAIETELESLAVIDRKVMVPMRDGKRMQADVYRPKGDGRRSSRSSFRARLTTSISGTCATVLRAT